MFWAPSWILAYHTRGAVKNWPPELVHERRFASIAISFFETIGSQNATASTVAVSGGGPGAGPWNDAASTLLSGSETQLLGGGATQNLPSRGPQLPSSARSNSTGASRQVVEVLSLTNHRELTSVDRQAVSQADTDTLGETDPGEGGANEVTDMSRVARQLRSALEELVGAEQGQPAAGENVCFEATAATQRSRGCTGYESCGYTCTADSCAAMSSHCNQVSHDGRRCSCTRCAARGPRGSIVDMGTGRCTVPSTATGAELDRPVAPQLNN